MQKPTPLVPAPGSRYGQSMPKRAAPSRVRDEEKSTDLQCSPSAESEDLGRYKSAASRHRALSKLTPWKPGQSGNPAGYTPKRQFLDDARAILDGGVPPNLRTLVSKRTGLPLGAVDEMSLRQVVILYLVYDYLKNGKLDAMAQLLDRTDPKTRRVEGKMDHAHTLRGVIAGLGFGEVQAAEIYQGLLEGGTVELEADASE